MIDGAQREKLHFPLVSSDQNHDGATQLVSRKRSFPSGSQTRPSNEKGPWAHLSKIIVQI